MILSLPIPNKALSPNARIHWQKRRTLVKGARSMACALVKSKVGINPPPTITGYSLAFYYPDARRRDDDNTEGNFGLKAYRDGIADALGVDDNTFRKATVSTFQIDRTNPRVEITLHLTIPATSLS